MGGIMFYTFVQNNSGGHFIGFKVVIIEAHSAEMANALATVHEIYFDGVKKNIDCECCGDRWSKCDDYNYSDRPSVFGEMDIQKFVDEHVYRDRVRIIYLNGKIVDYFKQK